MGTRKVVSPFLTWQDRLLHTLPYVELNNIPDTILFRYGYYSGYGYYLAISISTIEKLLISSFVWHMEGSITCAMSQAIIAQNSNYYLHFLLVDRYSAYCYAGYTRDHKRVLTMIKYLY